MLMRRLRTVWAGERFRQGHKTRAERWKCLLLANVDAILTTKGVDLNEDTTESSACPSVAGA